VPPNLRDGAQRTGIAGEQDVQPSIIVIISPGDGPSLNSGKTGGNIGEPAAGITPHLRNFSRGNAGQEDVRTPIIVVIAPGSSAKLNIGQTGVNVCKAAIG